MRCIFSPNFTRGSVIRFTNLWYSSSSSASLVPEDALNKDDDDDACCCCCFVRRLLLCVDDSLPKQEIVVVAVVKVIAPYLCVISPLIKRGRKNVVDTFLPGRVFAFPFLKERKSGGSVDGGGGTVGGAAAPGDFGQDNLMTYLVAVGASHD